MKSKISNKYILWKLFFPYNMPMELYFFSYMIWPPSILLLSQTKCPHHAIWTRLKSTHILLKFYFIKKENCWKYLELKEKYIVDSILRIKYQYIDWKISSIFFRYYWKKYRYMKKLSIYIHISINNLVFSIRSVKINMK